MNQARNIKVAVTVVNKMCQDNESKIEFIMEYINNILKDENWNCSSTKELMSKIFELSCKISDSDSESESESEYEDVEYATQCGESMEFPNFDLSFMESAADSRSKNPSFIFNPSLDILVVTNAKQYGKAIRNRMKIGIDYQIHPDAHCEKTLQGLVCNNVFNCGCVHIKRCRYERNGGCVNERCNFLHGRDMPTIRALSNFESSQGLYDFSVKK